MVSCYPNPANDKVTLSLSKCVLKDSYGDIGENIKIQIMNSFGQQVALLEVKNEKVVWDTQNIQPGVYFYSIKLDGLITVGKLIIAK